MKVEIKNPDVKPSTIKPLFDYFKSFNQSPTWIFNGLVVELDPTIDFKGNDALIRWTDIEEGFNDKMIINSLAVFQQQFQLIN